VLLFTSLDPYLRTKPSRLAAGKRTKISHIGRYYSLHREGSYKALVFPMPYLRSHAVSTERTILSPFTEEYRVLAAYKWHTLIFLRGFLNRIPTRSSTISIAVINKRLTTWSSLTRSKKKRMN